MKGKCVTARRYVRTIGRKIFVNWSFTGGARLLLTAICICVVLPSIAVELCIAIESAIYLQHTYHYVALKGSQFCLDNFIQKRRFRTAISCYSNYESDIKKARKWGKAEEKISIKYM